MMAILKTNEVQPKDIFEDELLDKCLELGTKWRDILRLNDWEITFMVHELAEGTAAQVDPNFTYKRAVVFISPDVTDDELEFDIVHELLHIRLGIIRFYAKLFLSGDRRLTNERNAVLLINEERTVDVMARILIYLMKGGE